MRDAAKSSITSLAFDVPNNVLLAGSMDGSLSVWSVEGRCAHVAAVGNAVGSCAVVACVLLLAPATACSAMQSHLHTCTALLYCPACGRCVDEFERLSNRPLSVAVLPRLNQWWATGRAARVAVLDPRAPALITEHVAGPNQLLVSGGTARTHVH